DQPNPQIDFSNSPFKVNHQRQAWLDNLRRAGVSCFGIGGTNAHVILEQPPQQMNGHSNNSNSTLDQLLLISGKNSEALKQSITHLTTAESITNNDPNLDQISWTLQTGRQHFPLRISLVANSKADAIQQLQKLAESNQPLGNQVLQLPEMVWLFPGQGSQQVAMAKQLYQSAPVFKEALDHCQAIISKYTDKNFVALLNEATDTTTARLQQTENTQPALFIFQYALSQLWLSWGLHPKAMLGHSLGEWVCACLADVIDLETALALVLQRASLMQQMPKGAMLAIMADTNTVSNWLSSDSCEQTSIAAINGNKLCVISGPEESIARIKIRAHSLGVLCQPLKTSHGFHSPAMVPAAEQFAASLRQAELRKPKIPFISNVTGHWIEDSKATDPDYWCEQMLAPVQFYQGLLNLLKLNNPVFLEIGAGSSLTGLLKQSIRNSETFTTTQSSNNFNISIDINQVALKSLPSNQPENHTLTQLLATAGDLWQLGFDLNWQQLHQGSKQVTTLPGYPFQERSYWISPGNEAEFSVTPNSSQNTGATIAGAQHSDLLADIADWTSVPVWQTMPSPHPMPAVGRPKSWLIIANKIAENPNPDSIQLASKLAQQIELLNWNVFTAHSDEGTTEFKQTDYREFTFNPTIPNHYLELRQALEGRDMPADHIVDLRMLDSAAGNEQAIQLTAVAQCWSDTKKVTQIAALSAQGFNVLGNERVNYSQAMLQGICQVVGQEYPHLGCRQIDLSVADLPNALNIEALCNELQNEVPASLSAWRNNRHWQLNYQPLPTQELPPKLPRKRPSIQKLGNYVILGDISAGLGAIWAEQIAQICQGHLTLASLSPISETLVNKLQRNNCAVEVLNMASTEKTVVETVLKTAINNGPINGLFISLPTTNEQSTAPLAFINNSHWQYNQKIRVDLVTTVADLMQDETTSAQWCCVQSSMSAVLGGIGLAPYAAANHGLDAIVQNAQLTSQESANRNSTQWFSINFDAALHEQHSSEDPTDNELDLTPVDSQPINSQLSNSEQKADTLGNVLQAYALSNTEVWEVTRRILAQAEPGIIAVSKGDVKQRRKQWLHPYGVSPQQSETGTAYPRPKLATDYIAPRNDLEITLCGLWMELLRLDQVGINDSFFDLGGHSLLAIQAIGRIKEIYPVELDLRELLEGTPTVANIAELISAQLPDLQHLDQMAALMAEVEALSNDEVAEQLEADS
ncbi:MAG: acyltransferase domain-containing protein, partial [Pseudomonadales bacterium]|nr:acyltransferase domain-containing protein [Pseudomonadales bacterium]